MNVRRIVTFAFVFAIVALVIGLSGCERVAKMVPDAETPPMPSEGITVGVAVALTGEYADPYGIPMQRGLELAREEINMLSDANITFVTEDALSTVEGAKAAVQTLVDQGVPAIVGIGISTHLKEAFPIADKNGVIAFSPISSAAGLSSLGDYIFPRRSSRRCPDPGWSDDDAGEAQVYKSCDDIRCRGCLLDK